MKHRNYNERVGPSINTTGAKPSDEARKNVFVNQESGNEYKVRCAHTILCMFVFKRQGEWKCQRMGLIEEDTPYSEGARCYA